MTIWSLQHFCHWNLRSISASEDHSYKHTSVNVPVRASTRDSGQSVKDALARFTNSRFFLPGIIDDMG